MRAWDLVLLMAMFSAMMGLIGNPLAGNLTENANISTGPQVITSSEFDGISDVGSADDSTLDIFAMSAKMAWTALILLITVLVRIIFIYDIIVNIFGGGPEAIAVGGLIQLMIWLIYAIGLYQLKSNTSIEGMA